MELDDEICLCFHVTKRKISNYLRIEKPRRVAQLSDCFGAGTGCGWCRKMLEHMFVASQSEPQSESLPVDKEPTAKEYAQGRTEYVQNGKGAPPAGATPIG